MSRLFRSFRILVGITSILILLTGRQGHAATQDTGHTNVVFIFADDLGWTDLGCFGSTFYETPHLDRLAASGIRFTNAYAACPVCSPTRASILTGLWPQRTKITDYIGAAQPDKWKRNTRMLPAPYATELNHSFVSMAEFLRERGYNTFFAGKWHLGPEGHFPEDQGFEINRGGLERGGPYGGKKYFSPYGNPRLTDGPEGEHLPDRLASEANAFISAHRDKPFFVYFPMYCVHTPLMARPDLQKKYEAKAATGNRPELWGTEGPRKVRLTQNHAVYAGMVEAMDQAVGKILDHLEALHLTERTLVVFTSDNGGLSTSEGHPTSNVPLRAGKGWLYEGGIRVPTIARLPNRMPSGQVSDVPVTSPDWFPTIAAATTARASSELRWDGQSVLDLTRTPAEYSNRPLYWHYPHYGNQGGRPGGAIRQGVWKLIEWYDDKSFELYNLRDDLGEQRNLAAQETDRVRAMAAQLASWRVDVGAVMPMPNPAYQPSQQEER
jgi:arylsulfatase A-like enzyme